MSFSSEVKGELARITVTKKENMLAEISGFLRVAGSVRLQGRGRVIAAASSENPAIARHYKSMIKDYFGSASELELDESRAPGSGRHYNKRYRYSLIIDPEDKSEQILRETGMLLIREGDDYLSGGIYWPVVKSKGCKKAYLRGIFLGCGTISDPRKSYHLEFLIKREELALDLQKLIDSFTDMKANISKRKGDYAVYMKRASYISDMLGIIGADDAVLSFENIRLERGIRGQAVRIANCDNANVDRTIGASERQIHDIRIIDRAYGIETLPEPLHEVAKARIEHPDASLTEIGESLNKPIRKAGVTKRFSKIHEMALKIEEKGLGGRD